jgi:predicted NAD-dependent protein-ADP-ribosyltransferase YbiA (DUF1768 family)
MNDSIPFFFFSHDKGHGEFSQWYSATFQVEDGKGNTTSYSNSEQYAMHQGVLLSSPSPKPTPIKNILS